MSDIHDEHVDAIDVEPFDSNVSDTVLIAYGNSSSLGSTGRILVRESGTEPVIRVMVEAETEEECEKYVDSVIDVIKEKGHCE
jgi:phosphoglucosamine mutase